jgi:hypothetical protein
VAPGHDGAADVIWSAAADATVVVHLLYLAFVAVGGLLALRWPWLLWLHLAAVAWAVSILVVGQDCPLTELERTFQGWADEVPDGRGFVDRFVEGVVYPERFTNALRAAIGATVVGSWIACWRQRRRTTTDQPSSVRRSTSAQGSQAATTSST